MSLSLAEAFNGTWAERFSRRDCLLLWIAGRSGLGEAGEATVTSQSHVVGLDCLQQMHNLLVRFSDNESPSASVRGKPLIGKPERLCDDERSSNRYRSIATTDASEVKGMAMESRQNSPRSVISLMIWDVSWTNTAVSS